MNRFISIIGSTLLSMSIVGATLVYDPITNSYINSGATTTTTSQSSTGTTATGATQTVISSIPTTTTTSTSNTGTSSVSYQIPTASSYKGSLNAMHIQLDQHTKTVMDKLTMHMNNLDVSKSASLQEASNRLKTLICLGIVPPTNNIYEMLERSADNLQNSIAIVATDIHGDIGSLEEKMSKGLLDTLVQQLEVSSMQNKVDSFLSEYTNIVDLFFEVSIGKVEEIEKLFTNLSSEQQQKLDAYNKNNTAYVTVMKAYEEFLGKSSFTNVVAAPNMSELLKLNTAYKTYRRSVLISKWQSTVAQYAPVGSTQTMTDMKRLLVQDFSHAFNEISQKVLGNLYPIDDILVLNQQIMGLRSAYTDETNGFQDCNAFVQNPTVTVTGPELQKQMGTILTDLNSAVNTISVNKELPTTKEELLAGLKKELSSEGATITTDLMKTYKLKTQEELEKQGTELAGVVLGSNNLVKTEAAVRVYLQKKYLAALEGNTISTFQDKLGTIQSKIEKKLTGSGLTATQTKLLALLQTVIAEFIY